MNNAMLHLDSQEEVIEEITSKLRSEESRMIRIIEAIRKIHISKDWNVLKDELFEPLVNVLEKEIKTEARKEEVSSLKLNRLSGELKWAERYSNMSKLEDYYKIQLQSIRTKLYGKKTE